MDVVIREGATVLELLASEDQTLLIRRNAFLVLYLRLNIVDSIGGLDLKGDGLPSDCGDVSKVRQDGSEEARRWGKVNVRVLTKICMVTVVQRENGLMLLYDEELS